MNSGARHFRQDMAAVALIGLGFALAAFVSSRSEAQATPAPMKVRVVDGDTIKDESSGTVYRFAGADACEADQRAALDGQSWPCGAVATAWLVEATLGKPVTCVPVGADARRRVLARCATQDHDDLAAAMIRAGHAVAYRYQNRPTMPEYAKLEDQARAERKGLWKSEFQMPWEFRQSRKHQRQEQDQ